MDRKVKYTVTVEGRTLPELKSAIEDLLQELGGSTKIASGTRKTVELVKPEYTEEIAADEEGMEEVESPFANSAPSVAGEVDSEGLPWDARIHASSKEKKADGTWRTRRNLDKAVAAQIKAELLTNRQPVQQPVAQVEAPVVAQQSLPVTQPVVQVEAPVAQVQQPVMQAPIPMQNSGHTLDSFKAQFPMVLNDLFQQGKINQEYVNMLNAHFQTTQLWSINDEQKAALFDTWVQGGLIQRVG